MIFVWLLLKPLVSLLDSIIGPLLIIGVVIGIDHMFQLGVTNWVIELIEVWAKEQFKGQYL